MVYCCTLSQVWPQNQRNAQLCEIREKSIFTYIRMYLQVDNIVSKGELILHEIMNSLDYNVTLSTPLSDNTL